MRCAGPQKMPHRLFGPMRQCDFMLPQSHKRGALTSMLRMEQIKSWPTLGFYGLRKPCTRSSNLEPEVQAKVNNVGGCVAKGVSNLKRRKQRNRVDNFGVGAEVVVQKLTPHAPSLGETDFSAEATSPALFCVIDERGILGGPHRTKVRDGEFTHMGKSQTTGAVDEQPRDQRDTKAWAQRCNPVGILVR